MVCVCVGGGGCKVCHFIVFRPRWRAPSPLPAACFCSYQHKRSGLPHPALCLGEFLMVKELQAAPLVACALQEGCGVGRG
jgi:hypothetical protein